MYKSKHKYIPFIFTAVLLLALLFTIEFISKHNETGKMQIQKQMVSELNEVNTFPDRQDIHAEEISPFIGREPRKAVFDPFLYIDQVFQQWSDESISRDLAIERLMPFTHDSDLEVAQKANIIRRNIIVEDRSLQEFKLAENYLKKNSYVEAMNILTGISQDFSLHELVDTKYETAKNGFLKSIDAPETVEDYKNTIKLLDTTNKKLHDADIETYKNTLNKELTDYLPIYNVLTKSTNAYDQHKYKLAFDTLTAGLSMYPSNEEIKNALSSMQYVYIIDVTSNIVDLMENKEYATAESSLNDARDIYSCSQFDDLMHEVKMKSDFLYATKYNAEEASKYVLKSGKKMLLRDFDEEDQHTILSLGAEVTASILNVDAPLDIIDLSHDLMHWGEGDYFAARLVLDAVGIIPVIGAIKYLKHADDIHDAAKIINNVDVVSDGVKAIKNSSDVLDTTDDIIDTVDLIHDINKNAEIVTDITKTTDKIEDASDAVKDISKVKDASDDIAKHYDYLETRNYSLLDKTHPVTNVRFVMDKIDLSDGKHIEGVFPVFDSFQDVNLPKEYWKKSFDDQKDFLSDYMQKMAKDPDGKKELLKHFSADEVQDFMDGVIPEGYIWHHNQQEGLMQLVDATVHSQTGHTGGMSIWGVGYN